MSDLDPIKQIRDEQRQYLFERQRAYRKVFGGSDPAVKMVLADLEAFCRAHRSCFDPDPRIHSVFEGRREVYLRIRENLDTEPEILWHLKKGELTNE